MDLEKAWAELAKIERFLKRLEAPFGHVGYVQLLIARRSSSKEESLRALNAAINYLSKHECPSCRYSLACALGGKSGLVPGPEKQELVTKAKNDLLFVLQRADEFPFQVEVEAMLKDPFLIPVASLEEIPNAIKKYDWAPKDPGGIPFVQLNSMRSDFWEFSLPLTRARFTRANGDDRVAINRTITPSPVRAKPDGLDGTTEEQPPTRP